MCTLSQTPRRFPRPGTTFHKPLFFGPLNFSIHAPVILAPPHPHTHKPTPRLQSWPDRREPSALRGAARLSNGGKEGGVTPNDGVDGDEDDDDYAPCDVRLLFVSGTGLNATATAAAAAKAGLRQSGDDTGGLPHPHHHLPGAGSDENDGGGDGGTMQRGVDTRTAAASAAAAAVGPMPAAPAVDMWGVLGRELWRPWPQADVVVHTGSQVSYPSSAQHPRQRLFIAGRWNT